MHKYVKCNLFINLCVNMMIQHIHVIHLVYIILYYLISKLIDMHVKLYKIHILILMKNLIYV